jgi:predicted acetyltransferase
LPDASRPATIAADFIHCLLGAKRLTTSGFSRQRVQASKLAFLLAADPWRWLQYMMDVTLHEATDRDLPIARNLVPYYIYDMSEHLGWACAADGRFDGCDMLPTYWEEPGKHAFMLRACEEIAGFALVRGNHEEEDIDYSIAEFFVLRKFRGRGTGERIARQLFDRFVGRWEVEQLVLNRPAIAFWRKVIDRYTGAGFEEHERESRWGKMNVIRFRNDRDQPTSGSS